MENAEPILVQNISCFNLPFDNEFSKGNRFLHDNVSWEIDEI